MKMKLLTWILMLFLLAAFTSAIGVSPGTITFYNTTRGGYAEQEVLISELSIGELLLDYEVIGSNWIEVEFGNEYVSFNNPVKAKIKLNVPEDAGNGDYNTKVRLSGTPKSVLQQGKTSSIVTGVSIDIFIQVIGDEIVLCIVGGVDVRNTEINFPLEIVASIRNIGNVRIRPDIRITVLDQSQEQTLLTDEYGGNEVLPTTTTQSLRQIDNNLKIGQYWAEISVPMCGYEAIRTFDVVEKGAIIDKGELVRIDVSEQSEPGTIIPVRALFKNTGFRIVTAKFKGEVTKDGKIVDLIETDLVEVNPGDVEIFEAYYEPTLAGTYHITGRVIYNNKLSYEREAVMKVDEVAIEPSSPYQLIILLIVVLVIVLLVMIIRKKKALRNP